MIAAAAAVAIHQLLRLWDLSLGFVPFRVQIRVGLRLSRPQQVHILQFGRVVRLWFAGAPALGPAILLAEVHGQTDKRDGRDQQRRNNIRIAIRAFFAFIFAVSNLLRSA